MTGKFISILSLTHSLSLSLFLSIKSKANLPEQTFIIRFIYFSHGSSIKVVVAAAAWLPNGNKICAQPLNLRRFGLVDS